MDPRTKALIEAPIAPTLLRLAVPNIITTVVQASTGLIETYFIGKLGTDALAGVAPECSYLLCGDNCRGHFEETADGQTLLDGLRTRAQTQTMEMAMPRFAVSVKQVAEAPAYPARPRVGLNLTLGMLGEGESLYKGRWMPSAEALRACGITPVKLAAKEVY